MADSGTLATTAQVKLAIGENLSTAQALEANTNIWILLAESDMEKESDGAGLVANIGSVTTAYVQWLAGVASKRAAHYGILHNLNSWGLSTSQAKLVVLDNDWDEDKKDLNNPDIRAKAGLN
jgi:DTW domain-containing protein YfiP